MSYLLIRSDFYLVSFSAYFQFMGTRKYIAEMKKELEDLNDLKEKIKNQ